MSTFRGIGAGAQELIRPTICLDARQVADMPSERQSSRESGRFNAYQINEQRLFAVYRDNEVALTPVSGRDTGPDPRIGPAKIAFLQGRKKFLQGLDKYPGWSLLRRIIRFVCDRYCV